MNMQWVADAWVGLSVLLLFGALGAYGIDSLRLRKRSAHLPASAQRLATRQRRKRGI